MAPIGHSTKLPGHMTDNNPIAASKCTSFEMLNKLGPRYSASQISKDSSIFNTILKDFGKSKEQERQEIILQYNILKDNPNQTSSKRQLLIADQLI